MWDYILKSGKGGGWQWGTGTNNESLINPWRIHCGVRRWRWWKWVLSPIPPSGLSTQLTDLGCHHLWCTSLRPEKEVAHSQPCHNLHGGPQHCLPGLPDVFCTLLVKWGQMGFVKSASPAICWFDCQVACFCNKDLQIQQRTDLDTTPLWWVLQHGVRKILQYFMLNLYENGQEVQDQYTAIQFPQYQQEINKSIDITSLLPLIPLTS